MTKHKIMNQAYELLNQAILSFNGKPVGSAATLDPNLVAPNYKECFVRDFMPFAFIYLLDGDVKIVRNFLKTVLDLGSQQAVMEGHDQSAGLMPASFRVPEAGEKENKIYADFGDRAIGRVAPVDSALWWIILLNAYVRVTGDKKFAQTDDFQNNIKLTLKLYMRETFQTSPAMLVPDGSFMIDRRMGVYGYPLEIQILFYGMLYSAKELLFPSEENKLLLDKINKRMQTLRSYIRICYWLDPQRLNEIHRYRSEEFGEHAINVLNIYPESIPEWLDGWLGKDDGYFIGNLGPGRMDFRYFALGNLLSILFGVATEVQADNIMNLSQTHYSSLIGSMPLKICYPAVSGKEWIYMTGSDPKNMPWSYHNGGHWPSLLWMFIGACMHTGRHNLAKKTISLAESQLPLDGWPEYYDGKTGSLIGRRAHLNQIWSIASLLLSYKIMDDPKKLSMLEFI